MFAVARGLGALVRRAAHVVRQAGGSILVASVAAAFFCTLGYVGLYFGIPLLGAAFFLGIGAAATSGKRPYENTPLVLRIGALVLASALPCVGAVLVGARLAEGHGEEHYLAGWTLFAVVTFLGSFVLLPLLEAAPRLALGRHRLGDALAGALIATGRRGLLRTLALALSAALAVALVPLLDVLGPMRLLGADVDTRSLPHLLGIAGGAGAVSFAILLVLGGALATEPSETRERSRSAFAFVVVGIALLGAATVAGTTLVPNSTLRPMPARLFERGASALPARLRIRVERDNPAAPGFLVVRDGATIVTAVPVSSADDVFGIVHDVPSHSYIVRVDESRGHHPRMLAIDEDGHRLDDGPLDRIRAHVGAPAVAALAISAIFIALAVFRSRGRARLHRAVRRGAESVVHGRLRAEDGQEASVTAGIARTNGWQLHASDGSCIVELPPSIAVLGATADAPLADGQPIDLAVPAAVRGLAFRDGATPCPTGAALVVPGSGRLDELVGTWALAPAASLLAAASVAAIAGTILTLGGGALVPWPWGDEPAAASYAGLRPSSTPTPDDGGYSGRVARVRAAGLADSIHVVSATETEITSAFRLDLANLAALPDGAVLGPRLTLSGIGGGSVLDLLGFRNGDIILAVAGIPVLNVGTLRLLLRANGHAGALAVRVARGGEAIDQIDLVFRVVTTLP